MLKLVILSLFVASLEAGYDLHGLGFGLQAAPLLASPHLLPEPIYAPPIIKAPIPIIKTLTPVAPVIKTIAPATSYASITKFHIAHPAPIIKTVLAPQPILKSYIPAPIPLEFGHGYH